MGGHYLPDIWGVILCIGTHSLGFKLVTLFFYVLLTWGLLRSDIWPCISAGGRPEELVLQRSKFISLYVSNLQKRKNTQCRGKFNREIDSPDNNDFRRELATKLQKWGKM